MANDNPPPKVTSELSGIRAPGNFQAVDATYYSLTDSDSRSVAALLVLEDSLQRPVRAELYLYEESRGAARDQMMRQAQQILQGRYYSRQPVPLRVLDVHDESHSVDVVLPETPPADAKKRAHTPGTAGRRTRWPYAVAALLLLLLVGFSARWFLGRTQSDVAPASEITTEGASPADAAQPETGVDAGESTESSAQTFASDINLPASVNAEPSIAVGSRVQVDPRYRSYLLSAPDADDGNIIGDLEPGETMTVLDGPILREGLTDTIVWWYVITDLEEEGWVPANTSEVTVLQPLP